MIRRIKHQKRALEDHFQTGDVDRTKLDFDRMRHCEVSMQDYNVFCCLICGKYLAGKHSGTPVDDHRIKKDHCLFLDLQDNQVYALPENLELRNSKLKDIKVSNSLYTMDALENCDYKVDPSLSKFNLNEQTL